MRAGRITRSMTGVAALLLCAMPQLGAQQVILTGKATSIAEQKRALAQATAQALANAAHNATTAQQNANTILQATTTQGVALLYGVDTSATAVGIAEILAAGKK